MIFILIAIALASNPRKPPTVNLNFAATATQTEQFGTVTQHRTRGLIISEKLNAFAQTDYSPAKNVTQGFLCGDQKMYLLEPFFDEVTCFEFKYNHNGTCPFIEAVPGYTLLQTDARFVAEISYNGQPATQWEVIEIQDHTYVKINTTWIVDSQNRINAYMQISNSSHYPNMTATYTDFKDVSDSSFDLPSDCDKIGISNADFNLRAFRSNEITRVNQPGWIEEINTEATTWVAGESSWKAGESVLEFKSTLGTTISPGGLARQELYMDSMEIPDSFDAREQWTDCGLEKPRNQGGCGSCWAFGATETLEDRYCITQKKQITLSAEYMVSCDKQDMGCQGGFLDLAWEFLRDTGLPPEACVPYKHCAYPPFSNCTAPKTTQPPQAPPGPDTCPEKCVDKSDIPETVRASKIYAVGKPGDVEAMQKELITNGPFEVAFWVFADFMQYKGGVYQLTPKAANMGFMGGHAVKVIGWGTDNGVDYWTIANSWGENWGENGFWRIIRGTNECGIESTPAAGSL